ncbi:hypothetical protein BXY70_2140 [Roseovarius halotolerans]|uniref:Uncharacterized protein n=1 Tax=Roseovarius halotolerans TaxID=505353 RepID=A0A1X6YWC2_9RHOB|nr:hypothetical protein [Roseovarius halotolerans]RKT32791.1 hypothetical protein BXY70_2140 [Roseovarius halotolerans]SLN32562.1 hypothetical protein ROH8110_01565 [Roseovarius halotolerans]
MAANLFVKATYTADADVLFKCASDFSDLLHATRKISKYRGLPPVPMVEGAQYATDIRLFGLIGCRNYQIRVDRICKHSRLLETVEFCDRIRSWRHRLQVHSTATGSVWVDHVIIDAGIMTPIVARYARFMYRHRHKARNGTCIETSLTRSTRMVGAELPMFNPAD